MVSAYGFNFSFDIFFYKASDRSQTKVKFHRIFRNRSAETSADFAGISRKLLG